jgi:peptide/nickel transport system substrate-binding protein
MPVMHTRWPMFVALVLGLTAVALFWFVVLSNPKGEAVPASGGTYTEGVTRGPERINPLFAGANQTDADLASLVFSGLVRLGPDGTPQPDLAERWEITGNGQSYVFHLRRGVAWQDGEAFDADDVVFTYRAIADPGFKGDPALEQVLQGVVVTARDPLTVEFKLQQTYAPFLSYLTVGILPRHLLDGMDANQLFNAPFNLRPVGTGPYAFDGRDASSVTLSSNPTYYLGPPHVSTMRLRVYPDSASVGAALRRHEIDGALLGEGAVIDDIDALQSDGAYALHDLASTTYLTLYLDTQDRRFNDADVRRALQQGINVDALINDAAGGRGERAGAGVARGTWAYSPLDLPQFDPGGAASALERAGWRRGTDGIRSKDGVRLSFTLSTANDAERVAVAENVAKQWRAIGVDARVQPLSASSFIDEHLLTREFEAALVAVDPGPDPDPYPFWHSSQIAAPGRNLSGYSAPRIDDVLERARQNTDPARRKDLYELFAGYLIAATPSIPLYAPRVTYAQSTRVHGYEPSLLFTPGARFYDVQNWYVETRVK